MLTQWAVKERQKRSQLISKQRPAEFLRWMICVLLLIATEPPLRGRVTIHCTSKLGVCKTVITKIILATNCTDGGIKLATFCRTVDMRSVTTSNLPEPGCLVYSSVTTNVDKLCLKANTNTKESKDVGCRKLSTDVIFVVVDTVLVITASGSPVGGYVPQRLHSVHCQPVEEPVRRVFVYRVVDWQGCLSVGKHESK